MCTETAPCPGCGVVKDLCGVYCGTVGCPDHYDSPESQRFRDALYGEMERTREFAHRRPEVL